MNKNIKDKFQEGFTLIELLVVIAIISLLSSIVMASLNTARAKGRDAKRLNDLVQVRNALALYYSTNGSYPSTFTGGNAQWWRRPGGTCQLGILFPQTDTTWIPGLIAQGHMLSLPKDPKEDLSTSPCKTYLYRSDGPNEYMFLIYNTVEGAVPQSLRRPFAPSEQDYAVWDGNGVNY